MLYTWFGHEAGRGVTEVSPALTNFLNKVRFTPDIKHLRLFSDGCGGQNKNSHLVHALILWQHRNAPKNIESIARTFPVCDQSAMPPDRVFGQVGLELVSHAYLNEPKSTTKFSANIGH